MELEHTFTVPVPEERAWDVLLDVEGRATQRSVLDALEARYPMLRGTIRDHVTQQRRPFLRFFAREEDLSHESPDAPLPEALQEAPIAPADGKVYEAMPVSPSDLLSFCAGDFISNRWCANAAGRAARMARRTSA